MVLWDVARVGSGWEEAMRYVLIATGSGHDQSEVAWFDDLDQAIATMRSAQSFSDGAV
jgi:hypothetical protein